MKKIYTMIFCCISYFNFAQESNVQTVNNAVFPVALHTGIPQIEIPLFDVKTQNPNFSFSLKVENNHYASINKYFSTNDIGDCWSLNLIGSIAITSGYDESYYSDFHSKNGNAVYHYSIMGLTGKFVIVKKNTNFTIKVLEQNDYADIQFHYTYSNEKFRLHTFTITDKHGTKYHFANSAKEGVSEGVFTNTLFAEKRTFYVSWIQDKHNNELLKYNYDEENTKTVTFRKKYSCNFKSVDIINKGTIELSPKQSPKRNLKYKNLSGHVIADIDFEMTSSFFKVALGKVVFHNKQRTAKRTYQIFYDLIGGSPDKNYNGFYHKIECPDNGFIPANLYFSLGAVSKIITPEGGVTFYEYEPNTVGYKEYTNLTRATPGRPVYNMILNEFKTRVAENYTFEEIPLTYDAQNGGYWVDLTLYEPYDTDIYRQLFIDFKLNPIFTNFPQHSFYYPKIYAVNSKKNNPQTAVSSYNQLKNNTNCFPKATLNRVLDDEIYFIKIEPEYKQYYEYVRAYYKKAKPFNQLKFYNYTLGSRIKRIKSFSKNTTNINSNQNVVNEQLFSYEIPNHPRTSSGYSHYFTTYYTDNWYKTRNIIDFHSLIMYKFITVETPSKGKVINEFDLSESNSVFKSKYPFGIKKYNTLNQLIETIEIEQTFSPAPYNLSINGNSVSIHPKMLSEKSTISLYESNSNIPNKTIIESSYDSITQNMTRQKIHLVGLNETLDKQISYSKLGNAYYKTQVVNTKNNQPLNRTKWDYQKYGLSNFQQGYNLTKTHIAKAELPFEMEQEITRYDKNENILEYKTAKGVWVSQIWGYNQTELVAKLENVRYSTIPTSIINQITQYSNPLQYNENLLITALNQLRNHFPQGFITTYLHQPLVGVSSITDPNGRKESYRYDSFNRLYQVIDHKGIIIKEYLYNLKN